MKTKELITTTGISSKKQEYSLSVERVRELMRKITEDTAAFILYVKD